jgi:hypothetical protein
MLPMLANAWTPKIDNKVPVLILRSCIRGPNFAEERTPTSVLFASLYISCVKIVREADTSMAKEAQSISIGSVSYVNGSSFIIITECIELPPMINSEGLWNYIPSGTVSCTLPLLLLQMVVIFILTQASHYILKRYGVPKFTTQLLVRALFNILPLFLFFFFFFFFFF